MMVTMILMMVMIMVMIVIMMVMHDGGNVKTRVMTMMMVTKTAVITDYDIRYNSGNNQVAVMMVFNLMVCYNDSLALLY